MRLELADFPVRDIRFARQTRYDSGILEIDKDELLTLALADRRIASADLDFALPKEQTRIVNVRDAVEPRVKVSGPGCVFPGILGPVETVGEGRTNRLSGTAVICSAQYQPTIKTGVGSGSTGIVDMWGPASLLTPLGSIINIVLTLRLTDDVSELDAHSAIQLAECRVAQRLAQTTKDRTTENVEVFELFQADPSLPRVVYILSIVSYRISVHQPHSVVALYGLPVEESLPTLIHPNEVLDGALTTDARKGRSSSCSSTWGFLNHPVVLGLLREHGKRLNFLGVILQRTRFVTESAKRVSAETTSQMARMLGAEGAITTRTTPSGNNMVEVMLTLEACERKGIKTVALGPEWSGKDGSEPPLVFHLAEADAIVSTGSMDRTITVPAAAKVIGLLNGQDTALVACEKPQSPWSEMVLDDRRHIVEGLDWWGQMNYTCKAY